MPPSLPGIFAAQLPSAVLADIGALVPVLLTIAGPALHLYVPRHRLLVEELVKDSKMTEEEARRQMQFFRVCAPILTLLGVVLLGFHFAGFLN